MHQLGRSMLTATVIFQETCACVCVCVCGGFKSKRIGLWTGLNSSSQSKNHQGCALLMVRCSSQSLLPGVPFGSCPRPSRSSGSHTPPFSVACNDVPHQYQTEWRTIGFAQRIRLETATHIVRKPTNANGKSVEICLLGDSQQRVHFGSVASPSGPYTCNLWATQLIPGEQCAQKGSRRDRADNSRARHK